MGLFLEVSHAFQQKGAEPQRSPIWGSPLCLHPLTQNDHLQKGNTRGGGACFLRSATTYIPWGRVPVPPNLGVGLLSTYVYTLRRRTTELGL